MGRLLFILLVLLAVPAFGDGNSGLMRFVSVKFAAPDSGSYLGSGWWELEPGGSRWSGKDGKDPEIILPIESSRDYLLRINLINIPAARYPNREMVIESFLDSQPLRSDKFTTDHGALLLELPVEKLIGRSKAVVRIHTPLFTPDSVGENDPRTLGIKSDGFEIISFASPKEKPSFKDGRARIALFSDPKLPVQGTPSSPDYLEKLLSRAGYGVTRLSSLELANPTILDYSNFDLLILPQGESFPAEARFTLTRYLRQGGDFISMGGYAFDHLYYLDTEGKWRGREELFGKPELDPSQEPAAILDLAQAPRGWTLASNKPDSPKIGTAAGRQGGKCLQVHTDDLTGWDVAMSPPVRNMPKGANLTCFWAKGDTSTTELSIEWREKDSSRWIAVVELTPEWTYYCLPPSAFLHWHDGTGRSDQLRMDNGESIGFGLAFTHTRRVGGGPHTFWVDGLQVAKGKIADPGDDRVNTRIPEPYSPEQIGVFDASFKLKWVDHAEGDSRQLFVDPKIRLAGNFTGYAAIGRLPRDECRWVPLLNGLDRYNRLRGSLGSMAVHYAGSRRGSVWAYFGVDNADLFSSRYPQMGKALLDLVDAMSRGLFLSGTGSELDCYRVGEKPFLRTTASNYGRTGQRVLVKLEALTEKGALVWNKDQELSLAPGESKLVELRFPGALTPGNDFWRIRATMLLDGKPIDTEEAAFVTWSEEVLRSGPELALKNNRFELDGAPRILFGSNETASFWTGLKENNPLGWDKEIRRMADDGLRVIRIHTAPQFFWPKKDERNEAQFRKLDAWVQLCRKHGIAPYIDVMDWAQGLADPFLRGGDYMRDPVAFEGQRMYTQFFVSRYKDAAGILYDADNEPFDGETGTPTRIRIWNEWLTQRYGTTEKLAEAWGPYWNKEKLGEVPDTPGPETWDSRRAHDYRLFLRTGIRDGWVSHFARAVREADPDAIVSISGLNIGAQDYAYIADPLDFCDNHFYHALDTFPYFLKSFDLRAMGIPAVVGEFGSTSHPTRTSDSYYRPPDEQAMQFLLVAHYLAGCGGAMALTWDHRDLLDGVFPWGLHYAGDFVAKDVMLAFRQAVRFFNSIPVEGHVPELVLCLPDNHRFGGRGDEVQGAVFRSGRNLVECKADFTMIHEHALEKLPAKTRALMFPVPYCISDETFVFLKRFVENGGALYLSGDISYDPEHRYLGDSRLLELAGVRCKAPADPKDPWKAREIHCFSAEELEPGLVLNRIGKGFVLFSAESWELGSGDPSREAARRKLYRTFLRKAGIETNRITPDEPKLHCFRQPLVGGGTLYVLMNGDPKKPHQVRLQTERGVFTLALDSWKPGVVALDAKGNVTALEAQGPVKLNGKPLVDAKGHFMLRSADGLDIRQSKSLTLLPAGAGEISIQTSAAWKAPVVSVGEEKDGQWNQLEQFTPIQAGGKLSMKWDEIQAPGVFRIKEVGH